MPAKPMLDDIELQQVQNIDVEEDQVLVQHHVPALEGDFLQRMGRRATAIELAGVITGPQAGEALETLREKFHAAEPVSFVADITTATKVDKVFIEEMRTRDLAGKPERFEYALLLREFIPPPATVTETPPPMPAMDEEIQEQAAQTHAEQTDRAVNNLGTLEVQVEVAEGADYRGVRVVVEGESSTGEPLSTYSDEQLDGLYRFTNIQAGDYTVRVELT